MAATVCPHCGAYTYNTTGYCQVCKKPLAGAPATPSAPPTYATPVAPAAPAAPGYAPPPYANPYGASPYGANPYGAGPYGAGPYGAPPYGVPGYAAPGYPPPYAAPGGYGYGYPYGAPMMGVPLYYPAEPLIKTLAKHSGGARWGAAMIDFFFLFFAWLALFLFVYPAVFGGPFNPVRVLITVSLWYGYYGVLDGTRGATLGKSAMGLLLVKEDMTQASIGQGLVRALEIFIWPFASMIVLIIQLVLLDGSGQGIGDKLARTYVVKRAELEQFQSQGQPRAPPPY